MAAGEDKVVIEIVLDDGSIKQGFATIKRQGQDAAKDIQGSFNKSKIVDEDQAKTSFESISSSAKNLLFNPLVVGLATIGVAVKKAFDFSLAGEQLLAFRSTFDFLAQREGIVGENLVRGLEEAARGLIDVDDLLQSASRSIVTLGKSAERLPEILDIANRSASVLGGNAKDRFEQIVQAIETGNQRALKNAGIILDTEAVYRKFAAQLGTTAASLDQNQKQFALLNAVIEQGQKNLSGVGGEIAPLANAFSRFGVALGDAFDKVKIAFNSAFGQTFVEILNAATKALGGTVPDNFSFKIKEAEKNISSLTQTVVELQNELERRKNSSTLSNLFSGFGLTPKVENDLAMTKKLLAEQEAALDSLKSKQDSLNKPSATTGPGQVPGLNAQQIQENIRLRQEAANQIGQIELQASQQLIQNKKNELAAVNTIEDANRIKAEIDFQNFKNLTMQRDLEIAQMKQTLGQNRLITTEQIESAEASIVQKYSNMIASSRMNTEMSFNGISDAAQAMSFGISSALDDLRRNSAANFKAIGASAIQGFGQAVGSAFASFGAALANGEDAVAAFANSLLRSIGGMLVQLGTSFILQGIAHSANPLTPGIGGPMIAAGAALATFGGVLGALGGGSGVPAAGTPGGAPIQTTGPGGIESTIPIEDQLERQAPNTAVNVVIQGDVLDSEDTGMRIVDIINKSFDKQGITIKRGVLA